MFAALARRSCGADSYAGSWRRWLTCDVATSWLIYAGDLETPLISLFPSQLLALSLPLSHSHTDYLPLSLTRSFFPSLSLSLSLARSLSLSHLWYSGVLSLLFFCTPRLLFLSLHLTSPLFLSLSLSLSSHPSLPRAQLCSCLCVQDAPERERERESKEKERVCV